MYRQLSALHDSLEYFQYSRRLFVSISKSFYIFLFFSFETSRNHNFVDCVQLLLLYSVVLWKRDTNIISMCMCCVQSVYSNQRWITFGKEKCKKCQICDKWLDMLNLHKLRNSHYTCLSHLYFFSSRTEQKSALHCSVCFFCMTSIVENVHLIAIRTKISKVNGEYADESVQIDLLPRERNFSSLPNMSWTRH